MLDRAIGVAGVTLALIFGVWGLAPEGWPKMPPVLAFGVAAVGLILAGVSIGLFFGRSANNDKPSDLDTTLFLGFKDARTIPIEQGMKNIKFWYALYTESIIVDTKDAEGKSLGGFAVPPRWSIFMIFERPILYRQFLANTTGLFRGKCEVETANPYYALVCLVGEMDKATLEIRTLR